MSPHLPVCAMPRGARETLADWGPAAPADRHITCDFDGRKPAEANRHALEALMDGASSILFWVHSSSDVAALAAGIDSRIAPLHLVGDLDPKAVADGLDAGSQGLFNADPWSSGPAAELGSPELGRATMIACSRPKACSPPRWPPW